MIWLLGFIVVIWLLSPSPVVVYLPPTEIQVVVEEKAWPPWSDYITAEEQYERSFYQRKEEED